MCRLHIYIVKINKYNATIWHIYSQCIYRYVQKCCPQIVSYFQEFSRIGFTQKFVIIDSIHDFGPSENRFACSTCIYTVDVCKSIRVVSVLVKVSQKRPWLCPVFLLLFGRLCCDMLFLLLFQCSFKLLGQIERGRVGERKNGTEEDTWFPVTSRVE